MRERVACVADVQIRTEGERGTVVVDGHDISTGVTGVDVEALAGQMPIVTLHLAMPTVLVDGEAVVRLPEVTVDALRQLGWTMPGCCECGQ